MSYENYFLEELTALRELGRDFAQSHPRLAPFLSAEAQDPDVERLLEGFAFLSARLRQKLDDEFPELSHTLLRVLWPHALRPIPSLTTLEFKPLSVLSERQCIPRGTGVASEQVQGTACRFKTCAPVDIYPFAYEELRLTRRTRSSLLNLKFSLLGQGRWSTLGLKNLRLHLHGEVKMAYFWYWLLLNKVESVRVFVTDADGRRQSVDLGGNVRVSPCGFRDDEALLPSQEDLFPGFRLLHEYLSYPEKFLYVDVEGLEIVSQAALRAQELDAFNGLELEIELDDEVPNYLTPKQENIRIFCTPVVNLFDWDARPLEVDHRQHEYRLIPEGHPREHYDIFSIDDMTSWGHEDRQQARYLSYDSFSFCREESEDARRLFWQKLKPSVISHYGYDSYVSFLDYEDGRSWPQKETISTKLTCTNRALPVELSIGQVCHDMANTPEFVEFANISAVTPCLFPIQEAKPLWQVLTYLSQNYRTLADTSALKSLMAVLDVRGHYDRQYSQASRLKRDSLEKVMVVAVDRLLQGAMWRGVRIRVEVQEDHFMGEGDLFLFGSILNELFACTVPINSFHELELAGTLKGVFHRWEPRKGRQSLV